MKEYICEPCEKKFFKASHFTRHQQTKKCQEKKDMTCKKVDEFEKTKQEYEEQLNKKQKEIDDLTSKINELLINHEKQITKMKFKEYEYETTIKNLNLRLDDYQYLQKRELDIKEKAATKNITINCAPIPFRYVSTGEIMIDKEEIKNKYLYREDGYVDIYHTLENLFKKYYTQIPPNIRYNDPSRNVISIYDETNWIKENPAKVERYIFKPFMPVIRECYDDLLDDLIKEYRLCDLPSPRKRLEYNITMMKIYLNSGDNILFSTKKYQNDTKSLLIRSVKNLNGNKSKLKGNKIEEIK